MDHRLVTTNLFLPCWTLRKTAPCVVVPSGPQYLRPRVADDQNFARLALGTCR